MAMSEQNYKEQVVKNLSQINKSLSEIARDCKVGRTSEVTRGNTTVVNEAFIKGALMVINHTTPVATKDGDVLLAITDDNMIKIEDRIKEKGWNGQYGYDE